MPVTFDRFRSLALELPDTAESAHMSHPDFRVGGRVFATLGYPNADFGMVKLTPEQQDALHEAEPEVYVPVKGGWGRGGATTVQLKKARVPTVRRALRIAWENARSRGPSRKRVQSRRSRVSRP